PRVPPLWLPVWLLWSGGQGASLVGDRELHDRQEIVGPRI
ncbi:uncharacterized protein METZ01_LOCUS404252, partial [marine metagenome]